MKQLIVFCVVIVVLLSGCKKDAPQGNVALNDTSWAYTKDIYLWYKTLPATLNTSAYADPNKLMQAIRPYSIESGFSAPVDRWSFAMTRSNWSDVSAAVSKDFGISIFFKGDNDLRVSLVEPLSPAYKAGVRRGWQITGINGNATINTADATIERIVAAVYNSSSTKFEFVKPDSQTETITLTAASFAETPIYLDSVYTAGAKKVGYLVYNSFLGNITTIKNQFASVMNGFAAEHINELVVDLRYNGGGYVELQNELANYLVPTAGNKDVMLREKFNDKYNLRYDTTIYFSKKGSLNLDRIIFIVSKNSASASELVINSVKPYMETVLIGKQTTGKAVGSFDIPVGDWYIFPISFRTLNKNNQGNYFNGMEVNANVNDGLDKDWGDTDEACLASALSYISTGVFSHLSPRTTGAQTERDNQRLNMRFQGAVQENRHHR